jgi:ankyrin repeat protein
MSKHFYNSVSVVVNDLFDDNNQQNLFTRSSKYGCVSVVDILIRVRENIEQCVYNVAIQTASSYGHVDVVDRLLQESCVDPSVDENRAIQLSSRKGHIAVVDRLLREPTIDPAAEDNCLIKCACLSGNVDVVNRLLQELCVDPSANDNFSIINASERGYVAVVDRLLQEPIINSDINTRGRVLDKASRYGHVAVVDRLLQDYGSMDKSAEIYGHKTVMDSMFLGGCRSLDNSAAICWACEYGHLVVVNRLLQEYIIDPTCHDYYLLRKASENGHLDVVERLLLEYQRISNDNNFLARRVNIALDMGVEQKHIDEYVKKYQENFSANYYIYKIRLSIDSASESGHTDIVNRLKQEELKICESKRAKPTLFESICSWFTKT